MGIFQRHWHPSYCLTVFVYSFISSCYGALTKESKIKNITEEINVYKYKLTRLRHKRKA